MSGYISKSEATVATHLDMEYRFSNQGNQSVTFEFKVSDRSTVTITTYHSHAKFLSTAHPYYNVDATLKLQVKTNKSWP